MAANFQLITHIQPYKMHGSNVKFRLFAYKSGITTCAFHKMQFFLVLLHHWGKLKVRWM